MQLLGVIVKELIISLLVGGIPTAIAFFVGGGDQMLKQLTSLNPGDEIVYYFVVLLLMHFTVYFIDKWWLKPNNKISGIISDAHGIMEQVGFSLHGIYRAITGALPVSLLLLVMTHGSDGSLPATMVVFLMFLGSLLACCLLSLFNKHTKRRGRLL